MTCSIPYWCRSPYWLAILRFYSLDQLKCPEVVDGDLPLFHERQGSGGEGGVIDGASVGVHDLAGTAFESVRAIALPRIE